MAFVWSSWYIVMILLVAGIAACLTVFFFMDKKDKVLLDNFVKDASQEQAEQEKTEVADESSSNEVKVE